MPSAFCVGCVLVFDDVVVATGYSRELPGNTHAEANALTKLETMSQSELENLFPSKKIGMEELLASLDVYTTLEPCSIRTSGLAPCADALIAAKIQRCIIGVGEPDDFVNCEGAQKLIAAGIEVIWFKGLEEECLRAARRSR